MTPPQAALEPRLPIFRPAALEHKQQQFLGSIVVVRPLSFTLLCAFAAAVAVLILSFLLFGHYTKKATVTGLLVPDQGLIKIQPALSGVVRERRITEGQAVRRGDILFVISSERQSALQGETQAAISKQVVSRRDSLSEELAKQQALQRLEQAALARRLSDSKAELAQLNAEIETQKHRVQSGSEILARFRDLHAAKFFSDLQFQQKRDEVLEQESKLQALERSRLGLTRDLNQLQADLSSAPLRAQNQLAAIERNIGAAEQELAESESHREFVVASPQDGIATAILGEPGQTVTPASTLLNIVPAGSALEAQFDVPSRAIGFIDQGRQVLLRYHAYPYQKFGQHEGSVKVVSLRTMQPSDAQLAGQVPPSANHVSRHGGLGGATVTATGARRRCNPVCALMRIFCSNADA
jgi:membrane fusion protein